MFVKELFGLYAQDLQILDNQISIFLNRNEDILVIFKFDEDMLDVSKKISVEFKQEIYKNVNRNIVSKHILQNIQYNYKFLNNTNIDYVENVDIIYPELEYKPTRSYKKEIIVNQEH